MQSLKCVCTNNVSQVLGIVVEQAIIIMNKIFKQLTWLHSIDYARRQEKNNKTVPLLEIGFLICRNK